MCESKNTAAYLVLQILRYPWHVHADVQITFVACSLLLGQTFDT